jgi:membrane protein
MYFFKKIWKFIDELFDMEIFYYASSLSFYTIFSIIPLIIIIIAIFTKMPLFNEYYAGFKEFILANLLPSHVEVLNHYIDIFIANSTQIEIIGIVYVIFTSIMFFQNYEYIVNKMFHSLQRSLWNSISLYWTMITLLPIVLVLSIYLSVKFFQILENISYLHSIIFLKSAPYPFLLVWFLFLVSYKISIRIEIKTSLLILSSFITAISWEIAKSFFVYYVFYNTTYLSIYGSFSILMFFFLWIYLSWIIFLLGLKLTHILNLNSKI